MQQTLTPIEEFTEPAIYKSVDEERVVVLFEASDLARTVERLKAKGVVFLKSPRTAEGESRVAHFFDPFGYLSEIVQKRQ